MSYAQIGGSAYSYGTATEPGPQANETITSVVLHLGKLAETMAEIESMAKSAADKVGGGVPMPANPAEKQDVQSGNYTLGQLKMLVRSFEHHILGTQHALNRLHNQLG